MNADLNQWIVTDTAGTELLITLWTEDNREPAIEVAPRLDHTRWGAPLPVRPAP